MRHANRLQKAIIAFTVARFRNGPLIILEFVRSAKQAADIYAERFTEPRNWAE